MAILEKRKAVNQLPRFQRYQDTRAGDRAAALRGETPITSAIRQMGGSPTGGAPTGGGQVDRFGNMAGQPKNAVTSALKGTSAADTTSKLPGLTSKTTGATGKTLTSTGTGAGKVAGAKNTGTTGSTGAKTSGSSVGSKLSSALAGAAIGAGTKMVIDKFTGTKKSGDVTNKTSGTAKDSSKVVGSGLSSKNSTLGDNIGKTIKDNVTSVVKGSGTAGTSGTSVVKGAGTAGTAGTTKAGTTVGTTTGTTKAGTTGTVKTGTTGATKGVTSGVAKTIAGGVTKKATDAITSAVKPKTGGTAPKTGGATPKGGGTAPKGGSTTKTGSGSSGSSVITADKAYEGTDADKSLGLPEGAIDNGDGTYTVGDTTYSMEDGSALYSTDENGNLVLAGDDTTGGDDSNLREDAVNNGDGTFSVTEDGMVTTYDANGNILGMEAAEGDIEGDDADDGEDDEIVGGNTTEVLEDGTVITLDENGDIVSYVDSDGVMFDANGDEVVAGGADEIVGSDGSITRGLGTNVSDTEVADEEEEGYLMDDEGNIYTADGNLYQYADGTLYDEEEALDDSEIVDDTEEETFTDDYGNIYDASGNILEYADGYGPEEDYTAEDEYTSEDEYAAEDEYNYEDVYDYGDEYADDEYYDFKKGGVAHMEDGGEAEEEIEPVSEEENEDGTITQYFDDGSSITYDADGEVYEVTDATEDAPTVTTRGITTASNGQRYGNPDTAANYRASGIGANADEDSLQDFLDNIERTNAVGDGVSTAMTSNAPPEGWPDGFVSNDDGTATYVDDDGSTVTIDADNNIVFVTDANGEVVAEDGEAVSTGGLGQATQGNIQYFDDGSSIETFDDGSTITYDSDGNVFSNTNAYETTYDDEGNAIVTDSYGNIVNVYDPNGNVIPLGGGRVTGPTQITNTGSTGATKITNPNTGDDEGTRQGTKSAIDSLLAGLNTYGGAGAAGAVLGALLSDSDLFSGGGGGGSSFDMTGVGAIDPRTTDFGIGPANYVGYDQYGTPEQMPELYGTELYQNLNAPGFNEVNPGDYARYDEAEFGPSEGYAEEPEYEAQGMAEGGMPQGGLGQSAPQTYYTFGKPVDPLQNLRNPAPYQQQPQQQMPPQAAQNAQQMPPQQALPQMGMAPTQPSIPQGIPPAGAGMKSGGLPALSNVPITQGRLNFRQGAAVHGPGDGQSDDIPAMLADGEYVIDADTVAQIGNGSTKAGAQALDKFRENIRAHKRSAPVNKIPPKTKALTSYLKGAK